MNESCNCVVVTGALTLYSDDNTAEKVAFVKKLIIAKLNSGEFNNAHDAIVRVSPTEINSNPNPSENPPAGNNNDPKERSRVGMRVGLIAAAGFVTVLLAGLVYRRRKLIPAEEEAFVV